MIEGGKMKKYKHRKDGYTVEANKDPENDCYKVYGYRCCGCPPDANWSINIGVKDFMELFEPIEEYCCDRFEGAAANGFFIRNDIGKWQSWLYCSNRDGYKIPSPIEYCQFCGRKPL